jgi:hypothetical protein
MTSSPSQPSHSIANLLSCIRSLLAAPEAYDRMHLFERLAMLRLGSIFHISAFCGIGVFRTNSRGVLGGVNCIYKGVQSVRILFCPYGEAQIDGKKVTARNAQRQLTQVTAELFIVQFQIAQALSGNIPFCYLS